MGKFDDVRAVLRAMDFAFDRPDVRAAIRALEQYERYEKLIEAAGKIDEDDYFWAGRGSVSRNTMDLLAAIISSLPDDDKRGEDEAHPRNMDEPGPKDKEA